MTVLRLSSPAAIVAALLCAGVVTAPAVRADEPPAADQPADQPAEGAEGSSGSTGTEPEKAPEEKAEEKPAATPPPAQAPAARKPQKQAAPADASGEEAAAPEEGSKEPPPAAPVARPVQRLDPLTGATLGYSGTRQQVHVLTHPPSAVAHRVELSITMPVQVNPTFTEHAGNGLELEYHFSEVFGLLVGGTYFWLSQPTEFTDNELLNKAVQAPTAAEDIASQWEAHAAFEFMPIYAKAAFFGVGTLRFGIYVSAGGGVTDTKVELQPPNPGSTQSFGDVGLRPDAYFNIGMKFFIGDHLALRLEVRDMVFSGYAYEIRGCSEQNISAIANMSGNGASAACVKAFPNKEDASLADSILTNDSPQSTKIIDNFAFAAALSVIF
jgi:outer membrane beta-barrel protein